jgi:HAD superfamily hydrolase (TIGR01458 family)
MRAILFDMDGVLYDSETPIAGAAETMAWVRAREIPHLFVTNTTSRGRAVLAEKLARFGMPANETEILTPCEVAAAWIRERGGGAVALFVRPAARAAFEKLECLPDEAESGAHYVVVGDLGSAWDFRTLNRAFRLLYSNPAARLIALGMTRFWKDQDGISLDAAPFVAALEHATGRKAVVFGKPAQAFYYGAAEQLGVPPTEVLMLGDDIETDIAGAQHAGLKGALVRTGKFRPSDLDGLVRPWLVLDSIAALPAWWDQRFC